MGSIIWGVIKYIIYLYIIMAILAGLIAYPFIGWPVLGIILIISYKFKMWKDAQF